jgi:DNA-binding LacI/PurR family transcriptional regulator
MAIPVTIEEIARLADVSRSTVSRVLNNHPNVRGAVREKVLQVVKEHNYTPNAAARSLASSRSYALSVVVPRSAAAFFADPFFPQVIQGISEASTHAGYVLMLSLLTAEMEQPFYQRVVRGRHFDGVIMLSSDIDDPLLPQLVRDGVPMVLIGRHPYLENISTVDSENREGARTAVEHLLNLGHRRVACITGPLQMQSAVDRRDGYKQALMGRGLPIDPALMVEGDYSQESGFRATQQLLANPAGPPTALFAASDAMALGALAAAHTAGLHVPDDLAVVGFDDVPASAFASPPLTTMRQPSGELGSQAVRVLLSQLDNPSQPPAALRLPATLVVRASCGAGPQ